MKSEETLKRAEVNPAQIEAARGALLAALESGEESLFEQGIRVALAHLGIAVRSEE